MDELTARHVLLPGTKLAEVRGALDLKLLPGESRQMLLEVDPCGREQSAYAVEVDHETADGRNIGGLVFVFVPPHDYF